MLPLRKHIEEFLFSPFVASLIFLIFRLETPLPDTYQLGRKNIRRNSQPSEVGSTLPWDLGELSPHNSLNLCHLGTWETECILSLRLLIAGFSVTRPAQLER